MAQSSRGSKRSGDPRRLATILCILEGCQAGPERRANFKLLAQLASADCFYSALLVHGDLSAASRYFSLHRLATGPAHHELVWSFGTPEYQNGAVLRPITGAGVDLPSRTGSD